MGISDSELPVDLASVVRSEVDAWIADLQVPSRDPAMKKFAELRAKLFPRASYSVGPLGDWGILGRPKGLPVLDNVLSAFKADDLEDLVVPTPQAVPN